MKRFHISILVLGFITLLSACTKNFEALNTDQSKSGESSGVPEYNFSRALLEYTGNSDFSYDTWRVNIIYCAMMTQQLSTTTGWYTGDKYLLDQGYAGSAMEKAYPDQVKYITDVIRVTKTDTFNVNLYNMARISRVLIFQRLTDLYGDIPYSEAGLGYSQQIYAPKYDAQKDIYTDMLNELSEAASALSPDKAVPGIGDLIYNRSGKNASAVSVAAWKKLAYSLMVRVAMRLTKVDAVTAQKYVEEAYKGGTMQSNADNAYIVHSTAGGRTTVNRTSNILSGEWNAEANVGEACLSNTFVDFFRTNNDPRLQYLGMVPFDNSTDSAKQLGQPNGYDVNGATSPTDITKAPNWPKDQKKYSVLNPSVFLKLDGPTFLVSYAQTELLLAEAAKRGWAVGTDAATHYANGVTAAMQQFSQYDASANITSSAISTYLAAHPYGDADGYNQINTQYWAASMLDWYEVWFNWRRSDYPALTPVVYTGNATGGTIPRRMVYPASEASSNPTNYQEAISRQGSNTLTTRVWWDK
jgi:hypothetical protein